MLNIICFIAHYLFNAIIEYNHLHILALFYIRLIYIGIFKTKLSSIPLFFMIENVIPSSFPYLKTYLVNRFGCVYNLMVSCREGWVIDVCSEIVWAFEWFIIEIMLSYVSNVWVACSICAIYMSGWRWQAWGEFSVKEKCYSRGDWCWLILQLVLEILNIMDELFFQIIERWFYFRLNLCSLPLCPAFKLI
jgi:hypothetical protein